MTDPEDADVVVRHRADGATELRVDGVFVMDDVQTSSEELLADHVLAAGARDVLVGGLGLGFTAAALLRGNVRSVLVAELHPEVVEAVAAGAGAGPLADSRLRLQVADVREVVRQHPARALDAIVLDVDNGPDFLVHPQNADLYAETFLAACARALRPGGVLAIWSMADSPELRVRLSALGAVEALRVPVSLQGREEAYWVLTARLTPDR